MLINVTHQQSTRAYPGRYQSFTDYKQANFGTKDAVERSYSAYSNSQHERHQAKQHMERMIREGMCKVPKPRIVPASNDRTKLFTPQCTILHRCEDDTGCCGPTQTCAPKTTSEVQLYFYVSSDSYVCIRFKEGFESFSMETRKCIRSKRCTVPQCEYGMYNPHEGRCPKKSDRINEQFSLYR
uniref:Uncharacterized protein n=1 Tax=Anopheles melas TaxID=34690 RepID=A0A182TFE2_9DIPT